jgi:hypothetical protein
MYFSFIDKLWTTAATGWIEYSFLLIPQLKLSQFGSKHFENKPK